MGSSEQSSGDISLDAWPHRVFKAVDLAKVTQGVSEDGEEKGTKD